VIAGIMQPYLFPYLGYFQLIHAVDVFVILDDVQYIKGGWINRNQILLRRGPTMFTFAVKKAPHTERINHRYYDDERFELITQRFLNTVEGAYKKSPHFSDIYRLLSEICAYPNLNVADFNTNSLRNLCNYMDIDTEFVVASHLRKNDDLRSQDAVIEINRVLHSDCYINSIGGRQLYSKELFQQHGITLKFIEMDTIEYAQFGTTFAPSLSIIDVLMFNSKEKVRELLDSYTLT
jgi:hypothetical protein